jgi:putative NADPH-quinone reductase
MKKILIIMGHPSKNSLNMGIADAYEKGAKKGRFNIKRINVRDLKFDPILHEGYNKLQNLEPDLIKAQKDILWADHIVWVFPIWWGTTPALLKGFIERIFLPKFAFRYKKNKLMHDKLLKRKSSLVIVTSGSSRFIYFFEQFGIIFFKLIVLNFVGIGPVKIKAFNSIRKASSYRVKKIFYSVEKMGIRGD